MDVKSENIVKSNGRKIYKRYSKEEWKEVRLKYESEDITLAKLSRITGIPDITIRKYAERHKWVKGKNLPIIYASIAEKNRAQLVKMGVTDEIALEVLKGGLNDPVCVVWEGKGECLQATTQPDYKTRLAFLQEYNKLTAAYPEKAEKEGDKHVHFHLDPEKMKNKSADEVISDYQRLISGE